MSYKMWFLTPEPKPITCPEFIDFVDYLDRGCRAELTEGTEDDWRRISLTLPDGSWFFDLRRQVDIAVDLDQFREDLVGVEPVVNAQWVAEYLDRVKGVYLFRCARGFSKQPEYGLVKDIIESFRFDGPGGLLHAQFEGWSNEDGTHITWEFTDRVSGTWWMGIRREGGWTRFQMDLGNSEHRRAFRAGEVPAGIKAQTSID